jgi:cytochrome c oxidase assembly protein subunit 15
MARTAAEYRPALHRFAVILAAATFFLIVAGALVTSNDAGLSVPDWPTSYNSFYKLPPWVGGIRYEHSHRMIAEFIGLLTIVLAVWTWRSESRRWMRNLALAALGTVILQGFLGGMTVLFFLPPLVSSAHAALGQTFFCLTCCIAMFTGRKWVEDSAPPATDTRAPQLFHLALLSLAALYTQLILGAMFRHHGMSWVAHVVNAPLVALILTWTCVRALSQYGDNQAVRRPAVAILFLVSIQLCLGFLAFLTRIVWGADAPQPELPMIASTVAHVATGALLLATTYILTVQVWRHVAVRSAERVTAGDRAALVA